MCIRADLTFDSISKSPAGKVQLESTHEIDMAMMIREGVAPSLYQIQMSSGERCELGRESGNQNWKECATT